MLQCRMIELLRGVRAEKVNHPGKPSSYWSAQIILQVIVGACRMMRACLWDDAIRVGPSLDSVG